MKKFFSFKDKALIFPLITGSILAVIIVGIGLVTYNGEKSSLNTNKGTPTPPIPAQNVVTVTRVVPDEPQPISGGIPHTFLVFFNKTVSVNNFIFDLYYIDVTQASPQDTPQPVEVSLYTPKIILIKTKAPIRQQSEYYLTITNARTNKVLSQTSYLSGEIQPTAIPTNNEILKNYLPYQTSSYSLEYLASQNIYIFHFKYDPSNSESITQQYDDAKNEAVQFIESKGININSIVVDYRSS